MVEPGVLEDKLDTEADFLQASCDDNAEKEEPEVLEQVVAQATEFAALFSLVEIMGRLLGQPGFCCHHGVYRALGGWLRRTCPKTRQSSFALARRRQAVPVGGS